MSRDGEHVCYLSSPEKEMGITREERGGEGVGPVLSHSTDKNMTWLHASDTPAVVLKKGQR